MDGAIHSLDLYRSPCLAPAQPASQDYSIMRVRPPGGPAASQSAMLAAQIGPIPAAPFMTREGGAGALQAAVLGQLGRRGNESL